MLLASVRDLNAEVIQQFAGALYKRAKQVVIMFTIIGGLVGVFIGGAVGDATVGAPLGIIIGFVLFGWIGNYFGTQRVFALKLMAQQALCQVQIEKNTKK